MRQDLIIDCDPGIDDAVAIAIALANPQFRVRAITTVTGNVHVTQATANACSLRSWFGHPEVPVAAGAERALVHRKPAHAAIHGSNGLGGVALRDGTPGPEHAPAIETIANVLRGASAATVTIAAIGPLTNIALLLAVYPELTSSIAKLVIMGTSRGPGNVTAVAEYNTWADPEAAERVFQHGGIEIVLAQLQETLRATVDESHRQRMASESPRGELLMRMIDGYADIQPGNGRPLHDAVVTAWLMDPSLARTRPATITVDTSASPDRGRSLFSESSASPVRSPGRVELLCDLDVEGFRELLFERVRGAVD